MDMSLEYRRFFNNEDSLESVRFLPLEIEKQHFEIGFISTLLDFCKVDNVTFERNHEIFKIAIDNNYIHVAVLPTGNVVYYKEEIATGKKTRYGKCYEQYAIYNQLNDFGLFKANNTYEVLYRERELHAQSVIDNVNEENTYLVEEYFPISEREHLYSEFYKEGKNHLLIELDLDMNKVLKQIESLENRLRWLEKEGYVNSYKRENSRFEVDAPRYKIYMLVTHYGDVLQYTYGKKSRMKSNYNNSASIQAARNYLDSYVG